MVSTRMHSKLTKIKSLSDEPLMSTASVTTAIDDTTINFQRFPSSIIVEGHSEITLKSHQYAAQTTTTSTTTTTTSTSTSTTTTRTIINPVDKLIYKN
uniref:Bm9864 n=1 Tax=Brugia malayi TaxID=6279 RepID=A0A1I9G289_BRUMA|nr:Bm9864 [Brugia malayi]